MAEEETKQLDKDINKEQTTKSPEETTVTETAKENEDVTPQLTPENTENLKLNNDEEDAKQMNEQAIEKPVEILPIQVSVNKEEQTASVQDEKIVTPKDSTGKLTVKNGGKRKREKRKKSKEKKSTISEFEEDEEAKEELKYGAVHVIQLFVPTSLCMLLVVITVQTLPYYADDTSAQLPYIPFTENSVSDGERILGALGNAAILLAILVVATCLIIILYKYRCYCAIYVWLIFSSANILSLLTVTYYSEFLREFNIAVDYITMVFLTWNMSAVGMISIFWKAPLRLQQAYLIYVSVITSLIFIKFLPPWTTWIVLVLLVIWDLVAVLCPYGPLRLLIETAKERNEPIFPALIYSSTIYCLILQTNLESKKHEENKGKDKTDDKRKDKDTPSKSLKKESSELGIAPGVKLGLGDFIFYSVLIGKVSKQGDWNTTLACYVSILMGLSLTLILLAIYKKALPALPISLTFGLIFYSCTSIFVQPFAETLTDKQVYI